MKINVTFTQEQIEEALKEIIKQKFKSEPVNFLGTRFTVESNDFALNRGPDKTSATLTIEIL